MAAMIKKPLKIIADKVFSRSRIMRIEKEMVAATRRLNHLDQDLEGSSTLLDKKMQYLIVKLDAYAEAADAIDEQMRQEAQRRHEAIETRLSKMEIRLKAVATLGARTGQPDGVPPPSGLPASGDLEALTIEILGPSGVGKTTILRAAEALRTPEAFWYAPDEIDTAIMASLTDRQAQREAMDNFSPQEFVTKCLHLIAESDMLPSQKISAYAQFRGTSHAAVEVKGLSSPDPLVHDELLLHRASSLLLYSDAYAEHAAWYFNTVPVPDAAVVVLARRDEICDRVRGRRGHPINTYYGLEEDDLVKIIDRSIRLAQIAQDRLAARGVKVMMLDASQSVDAAAAEMHSFIMSCRASDGMAVSQQKEARS